MGVKDLWTILEPAAEPCTLADLRGKRLAIDISGWIFQAKSAHALVSKDEITPHLRVLFWRLYHLVRNQVRVIAVFDGPAPKLKSEALRLRTGYKSVGNQWGPNSKFRRWNTDCKQMLTKLKIPFVDSEGDAEATCAYLSQTGDVDGCITEDSDALLFGATVVYSRFSCDETKVECMMRYRMSTIKTKLNLSREHLVALALLLGCDYGLSGVRGVGKEQAMKLINGWKGFNPIERMREWKNDTEMDSLDNFLDVKKPAHCRRCRHNGSLDDHKINGCQFCASPATVAGRCVKGDEKAVCLCPWHNMQRVYLSRQVEVKIRQAAAKMESFPDGAIIACYLGTVPAKPHAEFAWPRPSYPEVVSCLKPIFKWEPEKMQETLMPYFTAYDMYALTEQVDVNPGRLSQPDRIMRSRKKHGRQMYDVLWKSIPGVPSTNEVSPSTFVTLEFKDMFCAAFPNIAAKHEDWLSDKDDSPRGKKRKPAADDSPTQQPTITSFFPARKRLVFDSLPTDFVASHNDSLTFNSACQ